MKVMLCKNIYDIEYNKKNIIDTGFVNLQHICKNNNLFTKQVDILSFYIRDVHISPTHQFGIIGNEKWSQKLVQITTWTDFQTKP